MKARRSDFKIPLNGLVRSFLQAGVTPSCIERAFAYFSAYTLIAMSDWIRNRQIEANDYIFWYALEKIESKREFSI